MFEDTQVRRALHNVFEKFSGTRSCTPEVMKGRIFEQEQIAQAANLGVGVDSAEKIEFIPYDEDSQRAADAIRKVLDEQG